MIAPAVSVPVPDRAAAPAAGSQPPLLDGGSLTLASIPALLLGGDGGPVGIAEPARARMLASRRVVERFQNSDRAIYGINTGFGILANQRIARADIEQLQVNLILSHAVGVGPETAPEIVRLMLLLKVNALATGFSGVTLELADALLTLFNAGATPVIPSKGSLGASGDLAPLAHLTLPLLGLGDLRWNGRRAPAAEILPALGLRPLTLHSKEGLALINGTQFMAAHAVHVLLRLERLLTTADVIAAMSLEAWRGSAVPFDERIHRCRPHAGQSVVAANLRALLAGSEILPAHRHCAKVQDPYSLRCVPQVHGAVRDVAGQARATVEIEINSATDNPLVFPPENDDDGDGEILSGGNFHGEALAFTLDALAMAVAELASISERRLYLLLGGDRTGGGAPRSPEETLPRLLLHETGLHSGFMLTQYTAAALVSENKVFAHPACVDSIPSSLGQEDHVSMGATSATKLLTILENTETVLALELLGAAQALEFARPLRSGPGVEAAHARVRETVPFAERDHLFQPEIECALELVRTGAIAGAASANCGPLA